jgi:preprotein translocase subunit Sec61beta
MANINDQMNRGAAGLKIISATAAATDTLTAGMRVMKVVVGNGTVVGSCIIYNAAATSGAAGFTVYSAANASGVVDLAPDGFVVVGGAVGVVGAAHIFYTAE